MPFKDDWHLWCRLCAKVDSSPKINIFIKNEQPQEQTMPHDATTDTDKDEEVPTAVGLHLEQAIEKYFSFKITPEEKLPTSICTECHALIENFRKFNERTLKVQQMFKMLQQTTDKTELDVGSVLAKYGLLCDNEQLKSIYQTEVHSIELERLIEEVESEASEVDVDMRNPLEITQIEIKKEDIAEEGYPMQQYSENCSFVAKTIAEGDKLIDLVTENTNKHCNRIQSKRKRAEMINAPHTCTECANKFHSMAGYRVHMKKAHDINVPPPEFKCSQCSCSFSVNSKLMKHIKMHAPLELRKIIPCPQCDKKFTTKCLMQAHIRHAHTNERRFVCEECGVPLRTSVALKRHMVIHTNIAAFACQICGRRFKHKYHLNSHMETHDPTKHVCNECGLELNSRRTLRLHLLVHSNEMPHKCDYCGRSFKRLNYLKIHRIIHTGAKPYSCNFCDLSFAAKTNCRLHMKKLHAQEFAAQQLAEAGTTQHNDSIASDDTLKDGTPQDKTKLNQAVTIPNNPH